MHKFKLLEAPTVDVVTTNITRDGGLDIVFRINAPLWAETYLTRYEVGFGFDLRWENPPTPMEKPEFYVPHPDAETMYCPEVMWSIADHHITRTVREVYTVHAVRAYEAYTMMISEGVNERYARRVLPPYVGVSAFLTMSREQIETFLERFLLDVQVEIRQICQGIESHYEHQLPDEYQEWRQHRRPEEWEDRLYRILNV